ncbi:uncharacterized protein N0V89_006083 [Didymosphaeria variabile]|uniref:Uncharacterized protein n=1 Tax=Didymosphaeria variabile TaxID=1932322 RepID=A0A9W8XP47_9PLEO|nr:uncharacterized protein N0V89_006083 [Didymosphaeria variabile]KAJ4354348.1 hypothetical protein N0V89_006083 [Didymosphaeria variabile]
MASPPSTDFSGLACSSIPLGIAGGVITQYVQAAAEDAVSQLCGRPTDDMYHINPDSVSVSFGTELVDLTITIPPEGATQGSVNCGAAFSYIVAQCFSGEEVWGGDFYDGDFTYSIAKADSADSLIETLENQFYGQQPDVPASGFPSATVEASGIASGFPVESGIASGYPTDDIIYYPTPTATAVASGFPIESGFTLPLLPSGLVIGPGFVPSGVESGYIATVTPEAPVFPGSSEYNALGKVRRGSSDREEVDSEKRPKARWIMG